MKKILFGGYFLIVISSLFAPLDAGKHKNKYRNQEPLITLCEIYNAIRNNIPDFEQDDRGASFYYRLNAIGNEFGSIYSRETIKNFIRYCKKQEQKQWGLYSSMPKVIQLVRHTFEDAISGKRKVSSYKKHKFIISKPEECPICKDMIYPKKENYYSLSCCEASLFHSRCLMEWYAAHEGGTDDGHNRCPCCRAFLDKKTQDALRREPDCFKLYGKYMIALGKEQEQRKQEDRRQAGILFEQINNQLLNLDEPTSDEEAYENEDGDENEDSQEIDYPNTSSDEDEEQVQTHHHEHRTNYANAIIMWGASQDDQ